MKWTLLAVASLAILLTVGNLDGQTTYRQMSSAEIEDLKQEKLDVLKDLPGVSVMAFWKSPAPSEENGRLQIAVELRLRNNGIPLLAANELQKTPGAPILSCYVSYYTIGSVMVARTHVELREEVVSARTSKTLTVTTWENTVPWQKLVDAISFDQAREWLMEAVDEFCNAYRAANPTKTP